MGTYVVGDIHGCYNEWLELRDKILKSDNEATFILVGDIIDRGPDTVKMVQWAMDNITSDGQYQMVIGNHEDEKILWWNRNKRVYESGKLKYVKDLAVADRYDFDTLYETRFDELDKVVNWFKTLPYYKDIVVNNQRYIIVHASLSQYIINADGVTLKDNESLSLHDKSSIVWDRDFSEFSLIPDTILIHGHTPTTTLCVSKGKQGRISKVKNRYNVDCGLVFSKYNSKANLAALRLEDKKEVYLW